MIGLNFIADNKNTNFECECRK